MLTPKVEGQIVTMKKLAERIQTNVECILSDLDDVHDSDDMFIIEAAFARIRDLANGGYTEAAESMDEFEEDKEEDEYE